MIDASATLRILRAAAHGLLILLALAWFGFALMSGAGEGAAGLLGNLPNTLPWLLLLAIVLLALRWPMAGGGLVMLAGLGSIVFFHAWTEPVVLVAISLPLIALGAALVVLKALARWRYSKTND